MIGNKEVSHGVEGQSGGGGLRKLAMHGAFWTFLGFGTKQALRFVNRTILSYLIIPELFGVMTIVNVFILGLDFFSDVGIVPNIIQSKRGDEPRFLNTAWTLQVGRGVLLWICTILLAFPVANFYDNPIYRIVLPVTGLAALIGGFKSTKLATAQRNLKMRDIIIVELIGYGTGLTVMLLWAWWRPSIWALVAHGLTQAMIEMTLSHRLLKGESNRFDWERTAIGEIFRFGRWIFISTALTWFARESNKLIVGRVMDERFLGIYGIAIMLSQVVEQSLANVGFRVLLPSYSQLARDNPEGLRARVYQARFVLIAMAWAAAILFMAFGREVVTVFGEDYQDAGWMLETLAVGSLLGIIGSTYENLLVAQGRTFHNLVLQGITVIVQIICIFLGAYYSGIYPDTILGGGGGVIVGLAAASWINYPFKAIWLWWCGIWQPKLDLPAIAIASALIAYVYLL